LQITIGAANKERNAHEKTATGPTGDNTTLQLNFDNFASPQQWARDDTAMGAGGLQPTSTWGSLLLPGYAQVVLFCAG